jgi:hypothetical protein
MDEERPADGNDAVASDVEPSVVARADGDPDDEGEAFIDSYVDV